MRWPWTKKQPIAEPVIIGDAGNGRFDIHSPTWAFMQRWIAQEIELTRAKNDSPLLDAERTAGIRGEIRVLKRLAKLPEVIASRDNRLIQTNRHSDAGDDQDE